ncbi:MAG: hypothetical protein R8N24_01830 [Alphaproteobacteria bacterium]|nr:hypothetical protein [Alphaproteobacteria bacterium]
MKNKYSIFSNKNTCRGNMLMELLLSIALASVIIPFVFRYQHQAVIRAENVALTNQMSLIQSALEKYIIAQRDVLLQPVGRNITRVSISDLAEFGLPETIISQGDEKFQLRVLKSADSTGNSTLQGVVVRVSDDITPLRTREIVNLSGGSMGFIDGNQAYGTFGAWHTNAIDLGLGNLDNGIIETTNVNRDTALYLWRVPSDNPSDAQMMTALNMSAHDIINTKFLNVDNLDCQETISCETVATRDLIFKKRANIDSAFSTANAIVSGKMSADSKTMEVSGTFALADVAKLSSLTAENLWVNNLTLGGMSVESDNPAILKIAQSLDMTLGRVEAMYVSVGGTGSVTPRLYVYQKIEDPKNSAFYWDASAKEANFSDVVLVELNRMAQLASAYDTDKNTYSGQRFSSVAANKNATVSDYMNAINDIQKRVREKYSNLHLE